jgi:hypothetical protein
MWERATDANKEALDRIGAAAPVLIGLKRALDLIPSIGERDLIHAGPPLEGWHEACGALRGSVIGTILHAGIATDAADAEAMATAGEFNFLAANDYNVLGTFAGVITCNTPLLVVKDRTTGRLAGAAINEGRGKALRYGSTAPETLRRLKWLETDFCKTLDAAIQLRGEIDVSSILEQALHMGDDGHSRQKAASSLFLNIIAAPLVDAGLDREQTVLAIQFLASNDFFFLPLTIAAAKASLLSAEGITGSTLVTCMAANGARFGIQLSGLAGQWFTAPIPKLHGRYFKEFTVNDAGPMIGDSVIAETIGLGAFAMVGAPALAAYVGGTYEEATRLALEMYEITLSEHPRYKTPALNYRGTPFGIDAQRVVSSGVTPIFNSGIAHRNSGIGQIGAGFGRAPLGCFQAAVDALRDG